MRKAIGWGLLAILTLLCGRSDLAHGQSVLVVSSCGSLPVASAVGSANGPVAVDVNGNVCSSASVSAFAPNGNYANLTATNVSASVALPAGAVVLFQNTGTTTVSCTLGIGSATATANELIVQPGASVSVTVGSNTFGACIDQSGSTSNVVALAGGTGVYTAGGMSTALGQTTMSASVPVAPASDWVTAKAASTRPATTDKALIVNLSPNVPAYCTAAPIAINQSASTDVRTFTNTGFICGIALISGTQQQVSVVYGTGSTCGTGTVALWGATTADGSHGMPVAANGGFTQSFSPPVSFASAQHLCVLQSGAGLLSGTIWYADLP